MTYLTQAEADALRMMEKFYMGKEYFSFPDFGGRIAVPLLSHDEKEEFFLDVSRSQIALKHTLQNRARKTVILARLDSGGAPHRNPDGEEVPCPHLHLYREGFGDKWACSLPDAFSQPNDIWRTLDEFMQFCHIVKKPNIRKGLCT